MYVDGAGPLASDGGTRELVNPANGEAYRHGRRGRAADAERAIRGCARKAFDDGPWGESLAARPRGAAVQGRRRDRRARDEFVAHRHAQQRQAAARDRVRRRRRGQLFPLLRRPRDQAAAARRSTSRAVANVHRARTDRRLRPDRSVELPAAHGGVEARAGACRRQHLRAQTLRADAAVGASPGDFEELEFPAGVVNIVLGAGASRRPRDRGEPTSSTRSRSPAARRPAAASCKRRPAT